MKITAPVRSLRHQLPLARAESVLSKIEVTDALSPWPKDATAIPIRTIMIAYSTSVVPSSGLRFLLSRLASAVLSIFNP